MSVGTAQSRAGEDTAAVRSSTGWARPSRWAPRVLAILTVLGVWWLLSLALGETGAVPPPPTVARELYDVWFHQRFLFNLAHTVVRVALGMVFSLLLAVLVGTAMGLSRLAEAFFDSYILLGRTIPGLVWALLAVLIVGITNAAPILAVVLTVTPLITLHVWESTKSLNRELFDMAYVYHLGPWRRLRHIVLPAIVPATVSGAKIGLALSWQVVVLAELFGLGNGVGYQINLAFSNFSIEGVMAWTLSFCAVIAIMEFGILEPIHARLTRWRLRAVDHTGPLLRRPRNTTPAGTRPQLSQQHAANQ